MGETPKFTPGPWKRFMTTDGFHMIGIGREDTAEGVTDCGFGIWGGDSEEARATSHLIAAAPDLYDALREASKWFGGERMTSRYETRGDLERAIDVVLAKAEGRSP